MSRGGLNFIRSQSKSLLDTVSRNPMYVLSVFVLSILFTAQIYGRDIWMGLILTCVASAIVSLILPLLSLKTNRVAIQRLLIYVGAPVFGIGYFFFLKLYERLRGVDIDQSEAFIMYFILFVLLLFIMYMCLQTLLFKKPFEDVFMSVLKALFFTLFFSGVLWGGISLILLAINFLLVEIDPKVYGYLAAWVFSFIAPIIFASNQFSFRSGEGADIENENRKSSIPSFFRVVLLYVMVPLTAIYGLVLILYLIRSPFQAPGGGNFHGIVLIFSVAVLFVYFSIQNVEGKVSQLFSLIFPKWAGVLSLYHLIIELREVYDLGIGYADYFLIVFCAYVILFAIVTSFVKREKLVVAPLVLAGVLFVSILPGVGFYPVTMKSQSRLLIKVLERNDMWEDQKMIPGAPATQQDRFIISTTLATLSTEGELQKVINDNFDVYDNTVFQNRTGFNAIFWYEPNDPGRDPVSGRPEYYEWYGPQSEVWKVDGADYVIPHLYFDFQMSEKYDGREQKYSLEDSSGATHFAEIMYVEADTLVRLTREDGQELLVVSMNEFIANKVTDVTKISLLTEDEMRLTTLFDRGSVTVVFQRLSASVTDESVTYSAEAYLLIDFS